MPTKVVHVKKYTVPAHTKKVHVKATPKSKPKTHKKR